MLLVLNCRTFISPQKCKDAVNSEKQSFHNNAILCLSELQICMYNTWSDNKVRELIAVKLLHTSLLNTTVIAFNVLPLGSYTPISPHSPPFKIILEMVLWNGLQSFRCITPDVTDVIKMPSFQYFLYLRKQKKVTGGLSPQTCTNISLISFPFFPSLTINLMFVRRSNSSSDILAAAHQNTCRQQ